jgi:signal transduction histidine kinase
VAFALGKMLAPMRPDTALKLLDRLNSSPDLLSIDIGGTLAKVVLFQPCDGPPREGELPAIDLGEAGAAAFGPEDQQILSFIADQTALAIERKRSEQELQRALEQQRELVRLKTNFANLVSHEFRTPIGVILSSAQVLDSYFDRLEPARCARRACGRVILPLCSSCGWRVCARRASFRCRSGPRGLSSNACKRARERREGRQRRWYRSR